MNNLSESPLSLPINSKIFIQIDHLIFLPTDKKSKLLDITKNYFIGLGDELVSLGNF
jgi:hypothetical protein